MKCLLGKNVLASTDQVLVDSLYCDGQCSLFESPTEVVLYGTLLKIDSLEGGLANLFLSGDISVCWVCGIFGMVLSLMKCWWGGATGG